MKIVIVGTNHSGIAAANVILDQYQGHELVMIDRNSNLSYLGCGTALWVGRQIDGYEDLFYTKREDFEEKGAKILMETTVDKIDFENKTLHVRTKEGETFEENYDKLILATGSLPVAPKFKGHDLDGIHFLKLFQEGQAVDAEISKEEVKNVAVIGAGYIGVEIAEAAQRRGKNVTLFDAEDTSLSTYYDPKFTHYMDKNLKDHGIDTRFGEYVAEFKGDENGRVNQVITNKGEYDVDLVISAIGFRPNSDLGANHLKLDEHQAYLVDQYQQTSDPDVFAIGDCATVYSNALNQTTYIALASNAVRTGIVGGHNAAGGKLAHPGVQGSNGISIYGLNMVSTGLTSKEAQLNGFDAKCSDYEDTQLLGFMKENESVMIRIIYDGETRRILGAQLMSHYDISLAIHMFSLAIAKQVTIDELALLDIFFLPHFNQPYNYITMAALSAE